MKSPTSTLASPTRIVVSNYFLLGLLLFMLIQLMRIVSPFFGALLAAVVVGTTFYPLHRHLSQRTRKASANIHALLTDLIVLFFLVMPSIALGWAIVNEMEALSPLFKQWQTALDGLQQGKVMESWDGIRNIRSWLYETIGVRPAQF